MSVTETTRPASPGTAPIHASPAGPDSLSGHIPADTQCAGAAEGQDSPQATLGSAPSTATPAGSTTARPAIDAAAPHRAPLAGHENGRDQKSLDTQGDGVPAGSIPAGQVPLGTHVIVACGESSPPARTSGTTAPNPVSPELADPLLALAADVLDDLEKARISNENRLRQLTRSTEDKDGETRGFGLDDAHPDVARLAALVDMLAQAERQAALNLARLMRHHPLGPWLAAQKGIGEKQGARLLAAIGDPYIRPEIEREDGTVEPSRPRMVSELWAFAGYHVIKVPVSGHARAGDHSSTAADGQGSHPGHTPSHTHAAGAGVAPKRARGQKANWSGTAKMRAYLVAESCMKQPSGTRYRDVYEATRAKYAEAVHKTECVRCGPKGKPAQPGSPLSDGHKHARALRAVAKEVLRDLWREAKHLHETRASDQNLFGTQTTDIAGAPHN